GVGTMILMVPAVSSGTSRGNEPGSSGSVPKAYSLALSQPSLSRSPAAVASGFPGVVNGASHRLKREGSRMSMDTLPGVPAAKPAEELGTESVSVSVPSAMPSAVAVNACDTSVCPAGRMKESEPSRSSASADPELSRTTAISRTSGSGVVTVTDTVEAGSCSEIPELDADSPIQGRNGSTCVTSGKNFTSSMNQPVHDVDWSVTS